MKFETLVECDKGSVTGLGTDGLYINLIIDFEVSKVLGFLKSLEGSEVSTNPRSRRALEA